MMNILKTKMQLMIIASFLTAGSLTLATHETDAAPTSSWLRQKMNSVTAYFSSTAKPTVSSRRTNSTEPKMTLDELASMTPDDIRTLSVEQLQGCDNIIFLKMTPQQIKAFSRTQLQSLDEEQTQGLQVKHLTDDQITAINTNYLLPSQAKYLLPHFSSDQISNLSPLTFGSLPKEKLEKALMKFNIKQIEAIEAAFQKSNHPFIGIIKTVIARKRSK